VNREHGGEKVPTYTRKQTHSRIKVGVSRTAFRAS